MAKKAKKSADTRTTKTPAPKVKAKAPPPEPVPEGPVIVTLRARISGEVTIRLRVLERAYSAERLAKLLNDGNATWDVGDPARYHRIVKGGRVIAEIEHANEDFHWERYQVD